MNEPGLFARLILPEDQALWAEHRRNVTSIPRQHEVQVRLRRRSGEVRWIEQACQSVTDDRGDFWGYRASNRDITLRKQAEDLMQDSVQKLRIAYEQAKIYAQELAAEISEHKKAEAALQAQTYDLNKRVKELRCLYRISRLVETKGQPGGAIFQEMVELLPPAWQYPDLACARITLESREFKTKNFQETPWQQMNDIIVSDQRVGAVEVGYLAASSTGCFLPEESTLLAAIAEYLGRIIERTRLETERQQAEESLQKHNRELALLNRVSQAVGSSLNLDQVLTTLLHEVRDLLQVAACSVWLLEPAGGETGQERGLVCRQSAGPHSDHLRGWRLAPGEGIAGWTVRANQSLVVPDTQADPRHRAEAGQSVGLTVRSLFSVPLRAANRVIGVLQGVDTAVDRFETINLTLIESLAATAAVAIEQARLYEQSQQYAADMEQRVADRTRELSVLYEMAALSRQPLDLKTMLARSLGLVLEALRGEAGAIHLLDEVELVANNGPAEEATLRLTVHQGLSPAMVDELAAWSILEEPGSWLATHDEPLLAADVTTDQRLTFTSTPYAYAGLPLRAGQQMLGALSVFKSINQPYTVEDLSLLASVADQLGLLVESDRLRQQASQAVVMAERERLAHELHDSITQSLYSLTLFAEWGRDLLAAGEVAEAQQRLRRIGETANQALKEMRLLIYELRPALLEQDGLTGALQRRLEFVEKRAGVEVSLQVGAVGRLPPPVEQGLYRIAQEALNNALKHAAASKVTMRLDADGQRVTLEIEDNGLGFAPEAVKDKGGLGLAGMQKRAQQLGAELAVVSAPGQGAKVTVRVEVNAP